MRMPSTTQRTVNEFYLFCFYVFYAVCGSLPFLLYQCFCVFTNSEQALAIRKENILRQRHEYTHEECGIAGKIDGYTYMRIYKQFPFVNESRMSSFRLINIGSFNRCYGCRACSVLWPCLPLLLTDIQKQKRYTKNQDTEAESTSIIGRHDNHSMYILKYFHTQYICVHMRISCQLIFVFVNVIISALAFLQTYEPTKEKQILFSGNIYIYICIYNTYYRCSSIYV